MYVFGDIRLMPILVRVRWWGGVKWECGRRNASFLLRSLYLRYEVPHWLYTSKFTLLRAVSLRQHGSFVLTLYFVCGVLYWQRRPVSEHFASLATFHYCIVAVYHYYRPSLSDSVNKYVDEDDDVLCVPLYFLLFLRINMLTRGRPKAEVLLSAETENRPKVT